MTAPIGKGVLADEALFESVLDDDSLWDYGRSQVCQSPGDTAVSPNTCDNDAAETPGKLSDTQRALPSLNQTDLEIAENHEKSVPANSNGCRPSVTEILADIEDVGKISDRAAEFRPVGLCVTDFSAAEWCQQQVAFSLCAPLPEETTAMKAGQELHAILEAETALDKVQLPTESEEDRFAIRLLNMAQGLKQLMLEGMTRELPILGRLQGHYVRGIIDQLAFDKEGAVEVTEQKTRFQPSVPGSCQKQTTALQIMLYRDLLEHLKSFLDPDSSYELFKSRGLDPQKPLSQIIQEHAEMWDLQGKSLEVLCSRVREIAQLLPTCSNELKVNYIWQGDQTILETDIVHFDQHFLNAAVTRHLEFWSGQAAPSKLPDNEHWKCNRCQFNVKCWPERTRLVPWQH